MPIADDGDLIRGLGFVALYAAYLEEALDDVLEVLLLRADPLSDARIHRRPTSQKIEYIRERIKTLEPLPKELARLPEMLDGVAVLLERRNLVIHGRVYAVPGVGDFRRPARRGSSEEPATSAELYGLANDLYSACRPLNHASMFALPRHLSGIGPAGIT